MKSRVEWDEAREDFEALSTPPLGATDDENCKWETQQMKWKAQMEKAEAARRNGNVKAMDVYNIKYGKREDFSHCLTHLNALNMYSFLPQAASRKAIQTRLMEEERNRAEGRKQTGPRNQQGPGVGVVKWVSLGIQIEEQQ